MMVKTESRDELLGISNERESRKQKNGPMEH